MMRKTIVKLASVIFPGMIVKLAYSRITNPRVRKLRPHELEVLNKAEKKVISYKDFQIQTYKWNGGSKKVLLIHGWEGQAGNFSDLIEKLLQNNYTVYAFDGPSHGFSSKGENSFFEFIDLVGVVIRTFKVDKLVSHSYGGVATTFTLFDNPDLEVTKYVLLTVPDKFQQRLDDVSQQVGMTDRVKNKLINYIEEATTWKIHTLNVSDKVKNVNVKSSLIIHDKDDKVIPIGQSENVWKNWKQCEFHKIEGTGHFKILRSEKVLNKVVEFLN